MSALKMFVVLALLVGFFFVNVSPTFASGEEQTQKLNTFEKSDMNVMGFFHTFSCVVEGQSIFADQKCNSFVNKLGLAVDHQDNHLGQTSSGGLLQLAGYLNLVLISNPPLSTNEYLAHTFENLNLVPTANAQVSGSGSDVLSVIFIFWEAARNIAYICMALIFVVVGLMILFGRKNGSQGVLTVQAALPGLVVGLVLITFSYFFAAFITDLAFVGVNLVGYTFDQIVNVTDQPTKPILDSYSLIGIYKSFIGTADGGMFIDIANQLVMSDGGLGTFIRTITAMFVFNYSNAVTGVFNVIPGFGPSITTGVSALNAANAFRDPAVYISIGIYFILVLALIYAMFKLFLTLLNKYITILFLTIAAPFQFMIGSMPGNQKMIESWIISMLCNVLAFPAVFGAFYFAAYFIGPTKNTVFGITKGGLGDGATMPLFGNTEISLVGQLIGYGILLATPAIPDFICKSLKAASNEVFGNEIKTRFSEGQSKLTGFGGKLGGVAKAFKKEGSSGTSDKAKL